MTWLVNPTGEGTEFTYRFHTQTPRGMGWLGQWIVRSTTGHLDIEIPALINRYQ